MSLIDRMIGLQSRLQPIGSRLGVPQYRHLLIRHSVLDDDLLSSHTDTLISPKPYIESVPTRLVGFEIAGMGGGGIVISADDFQVKELPRSYPQEFFTKDVSLVVIDPAVVAHSDGSLEVLYDSSGDPAGGIFCKVLSLRDSDLLSWKLLLRRIADRTDLDNPTVSW